MSIIDCVFLGAIVGLIVVFLLEIKKITEERDGIKYICSEMLVLLVGEDKYINSTTQERHERYNNSLVLIKKAQSLMEGEGENNNEY